MSARKYVQQGFPTNDCEWDKILAAVKPYDRHIIEKIQKGDGFHIAKDVGIETEVDYSRINKALQKADLPYRLSTAVPMFQLRTVGMALVRGKD